MRLQNLEICGFKSFPERANLAFDGGVTAIVGPNGCGKSNVIDAITWVLGEQSAKSLRGERMEDVIFSGSDARKATGTAEVKLFLARVTAAPGTVGGGEPALATKVDASADADATGAPTTPADGADMGALLPLITRDVEVGRRLYRSGESEYLIDGRVCRLRDVQDLLMDSGVGVKAYAVIEQGKIGQILGARPTERRQLLEEAAGVTKYKSRRRSAELKLESARQNLTRVDDVIYEVEKQRRALKRQAAKARRYRRLREDLRRWETVGFARRYGVLREAISVARRRLEEARARAEEAAARLAAVEGERERYQIEVAEAESGAKQSRDAAHARELAVERRQQQIAFDTQQVAALAVTLTELDRDVSDLEAKQEPARRELDTQLADARRCGAERDELGSTLRGREEALVQAHQALDGLETAVEASRSDMYAAINAATALRHAVEHATAGQTRLAESLSKLDAEARDVAVETQALEAGRERARTAQGATRSALEEARQACADRDDELNAIRADRESRARELREQEQQLAGLTGRLTSLRDLQAARTGYSDAARSLLSSSDAGIRHWGAVADHLEVETGREKAVEACLGDLLQYVVVPTRADAEAGLAFVRQHGAGRVGFLVVEGHPTEPTVAPPAHESLVSVARVVRVDGNGAHAVRAELENHWLAGSWAEASRAAAHTAAQIATPTGDVFHGPARVSGGDKSEALGILATKREIRELELRIGREQALVQQLTTDLGELGLTAERAEAAVAALRLEEHELEKAMLSHEMQLASFDDEEVRLGRKREIVVNERRSANEELAALEVRRTEALASISRLEGEQREADERLVSAQRRVMNARERIDRVAVEAAEAKAAHAGLVERAAGYEASARRLELVTQELANRFATRQADRARTRTGREALLAAVAASTTQLDDDVAGLASLRDAVRGADDEVLQLRADLETREGEVRVARAGQETAREEVAALDVARATADGNLTHLEETCRDTLQLTLDEVTEALAELERDGEFDPDSELLIQPMTPVGADTEGDDSDHEDDDDASPAAASEGSEATGAAASAAPASGSTAPMTVERMVAILRAKIDRLGPVNMMAIEEFDDLDERYEFLTTQRGDLEESIKATGDAISRMNRTTRERFREAFHAINTHFQDTFSTLFGGGRAGLVLLDETDLLESGIDIIAQPPGKRLQSIQLLSGGEKALTAMALMFAIFKYKPSPFCLLDEIDAPLDEANVGRFVEMLRAMQSETQFILVTHNRKTMEIADRLYGVTMEEPGVSKLISVALA
ncbi:MAG: chromosome segregation protein SMC [Acidobacteria bacterium]|nr:chromosome segregation protein SMC [Acidobacteriota bacterium]